MLRTRSVLRLCLDLDINIIMLYFMYFTTLYSLDVISKHIDDASLAKSSLRFQNMFFFYLFRISDHNIYKISFFRYPDIFLARFSMNNYANAKHYVILKKPINKGFEIIRELYSCIW